MLTNRIRTSGCILGNQTYPILAAAVIRPFHLLIGRIQVFNEIFWQRVLDIVLVTKAPAPFCSIHIRAGEHKVWLATGIDFEIGPYAIHQEGIYHRRCWTPWPWMVASVVSKVGYTVQAWYAKLAFVAFRGYCNGIHFTGTQILEAPFIRFEQRIRIINEFVGIVRAYCRFNHKSPNSITLDNSNDERFLTTRCIWIDSRAIALQVWRNKQGIVLLQEYIVFTGLGVGMANKRIFFVGNATITIEPCPVCTCSCCIGKVFETN